VRPRLVAAAAAASLLLTATPVLAQEVSPSPVASAASSAAADADIFELLPEMIGGVPPETSVLRGMDHLDGLDPEDDGDAQEIASLESFVAPLGAGIEDMTSVSAVAVDGEALAFVAGIQVAGADPESLLAHYIETLIAEMGSPYQELGEIAGKTATLVVDEASEDQLPLYVYGSGPRVWLIVAGEATVEELLSQLP
jgi:hypothetical protein